MTLTQDQEKVVGLSTGKHLVLAPPGSGKTEMLSQRILRALEEGVPPERMLCATFTNRAAFEMRDRMEAVADGRALPDVGNIHHFCHRFLLSVGRIHPGVHVLDEFEQMDFVREVVEVLRLELKTGETSDLKRTHGVAVMGLIKGMCEPMRVRLHGLLETTLADYFEKGKNPYVDFLSAALIVHQQRIGIPPCYLRQLPPGLLALVGDGVASAIERAYSGLKRRFRCVDFDDLLDEAYLFLNQHSLPDEKRYDWIQIDEVQDLNPLQWYIVRALASASATVVYFGDVEQAIFSFLGASTGHFALETAECERHYFKTNFRATPLLLEILMRFSLEELRSEWEFLPAPADVRRQNVEVTLSGDSNPNVVVERVCHLLQKGIAENVAILVRDNASADAYERIVGELGFRMAKVSGVDLFSYEPMRDFLAFVSLFAAKPPTTAWVALVRRFSKGVFSRSAARYFVRGMFAVRWSPMQILAEKNPVPATPFAHSKGNRWAWSHRSALNSLRSTLKPSYDRIRRRMGIPVSFRSLFEEFAGIALTAENSRYSVCALMPEARLVPDAAAKVPYELALKHAFERIETFLRYADVVYRDDKRSLERVLAEDWDKLSKLKEADLLVGDEKIVISTIHKAKGRQFDAVIVPSVAEVVDKCDAPDADESKRLLYVAMSRAKHHLSLFGCPAERARGSWIHCFEQGYRGYYLRKDLGENVSEDWLASWEWLADCNARRECPTAIVEKTLMSGSDPEIRMALKTLRHDRDFARARAHWLSALKSSCADTALTCLAQRGHFDAETMSIVRTFSLQTKIDCARRAAFAYFQSDLASEVSTEMSAYALSAIGDFLYCPSGELRRQAASVLTARGDKRWIGVITGAQRDFERLSAVKDDEHEASIRLILSSDPSDCHGRALRRILFRRARRTAA